MMRRNPGRPTPTIGVGGGRRGWLEGGHIPGARSRVGLALHCHLAQVRGPVRCARMTQRTSLTVSEVDSQHPSPFPLMAETGQLAYSRVPVRRAQVMGQDSVTLTAVELGNDSVPLSLWRRLPIWLEAEGWWKRLACKREHSTSITFLELDPELLNMPDSPDAATWLKSEGLSAVPV
jgi:hypothetical protein